MAHMHFRRTPYYGGGGQASKRLEYITRQPERELTTSERHLRYAHGDREDLIFSTTRNLPTWAADNPYHFFRAAERHERGDWIAFEEWKMSLPQELSHQQNMRLARDLVQAIAGDTLPITYAFHDPKTMDGQQQQPHLHLLISARQTDAYERTAAQHFQRFNRAHPERGGAQKALAFTHNGAVKAHRMLITDMINLHLERAGVTARVHPDTLADRGMERKPEPKLLPSDSRKYRDGKITDTMATVLDIRAERAPHREQEQANARAYWEHRKQELGMSRDMPLEGRLERICEARVHRITHAPERNRARDAARELEHSLSGLEGYVKDLAQQLYIERHYERRGKRQPTRGLRPVREQQHIERLLADGARHGLPRDPEAERAVAVAQSFQRLQRLSVAEQLEALARRLGEDEPQHGAPLHVRLHDDERQHDRGMSW